MATTDERLAAVEAEIEKALTISETQIGDVRVRKQALRALLEYEDRMLARKARENYEPRVYVRFNFTK